MGWLSGVGGWSQRWVGHRPPLPPAPAPCPALLNDCLFHSPQPDSSSCRLVSLTHPPPCLPRACPLTSPGAPQAIWVCFRPRACPALPCPAAPATGRTCARPALPTTCLPSACSPPGGLDVLYARGHMRRGGQGVVGLPSGGCRLVLPHSVACAE